MASNQYNGDVEHPAIVWFRDDLRLSDNPALHAAAQFGRPLICVFVHDETEGMRPLGGAARWWLHGSLQELSGALEVQGGQLLIFVGAASQIIPRLATNWGASAVFWNRRYGSAERHVDEAIKTELNALHVEAQSFNGHLLYEPWSIKPNSGASYRVFSAFWRAAHAVGEPKQPLAAPSRLQFIKHKDECEPAPVQLADLTLEPSSPDWASGLRANWQRGQTGAQVRLDRFLDNDMKSYADFRDYPDRASTSRIADVNAVNIPVFDAEQRFLGVLSCFGPATRLTAQRFPAVIKILRHAASQIAGELR